MQFPILAPIIDNMHVITPITVLETIMLVFKKANVNSAPKWKKCFFRGYRIKKEGRGENFLEMR